MIDLENLDRKTLLELLRDAAKNWLAHDGLWFQAVEKEFGIETAIKLDREAWSRFSPIEAKRIMERLNIKEGGGIKALMQALKFRLYAHINVQEIIEIDESRCIFRMVNCRVQEARKRKGLPDFPCKSVGLVEYETFAKTIDSRIKTRCIACPPDDHSEEYYCAWEFSVENE